jgi:HSP20 family protein
LIERFYRDVIESGNLALVDELAAVDATRKELAMLTRWSDMGMGWDRSFAALDDFRREMEQVFRRLDEDWGSGAPLGGAETLSSGGGSRLQIEDAGDEVVVMAELPGFKADDVKVSIEQSLLTIRGERGDEVPQGYKVHRKERSAVRFTRTVALPARVEADNVQASLKNGVLELRLPKAADERPRTITIKAA